MGQTPTEKKAPADRLTVTDERTGKTYTIPYVAFQFFLFPPSILHSLNKPNGYLGSFVAVVKSFRVVNNAIAATAFKQMKAPKKAGEREENETERGLRVHDKGFLNTAVISSKITYIDGDNGGELSHNSPPLSTQFDHSLLLNAYTCTNVCVSVLRYRGYPIEQLAAQSNFLEVAYLLIYGELPTQKRYDTFEREIMHHTVVHHDAENLFRAFRYNAHPMSILTSAFAALGSFYEEVRSFEFAL